MLNEKHMPKSYWAKAANTAVYLMNRCTTSGVHEAKIVFNESTSWYAPEPNPSEPSTNDLDNTEEDDKLRSIPEENSILCASILIFIMSHYMQRARCMKAMGRSIIVVTLTMVKEGNCMKRIGDKSDDSRSS